MEAEQSTAEKAYKRHTFGIVAEEDLKGCVFKEVSEDRRKSIEELPYELDNRDCRTLERRQQRSGPLALQGRQRRPAIAPD